MRCARCGRENPKDAIRCKHCGRNLVSWWRVIGVAIGSVIGYAIGYVIGYAIVAGRTTELLTTDVILATIFGAIGWTVVWLFLELKSQQRLKAKVTRPDAGGDTSGQWWTKRMSPPRS